MRAAWSIGIAKPRPIEPNCDCWPPDDWPPSDAIAESATPLGSGAGGLGLDPGAPEEDPDRNVLLASQQEEVRAANARLPERQRLAIILNEIGQMAVDGRIPDHIDSSRYELLFQLYSTLRAAQLRALSAGRHVLPQLPTATVVTELPQVTSRVHLVAPGETLELVGVLEGLHRVAVLSGTAELTLPSFPEVVLVAATGELPEKDQPSIAQELAEELTEEPLHKDPQGMPFLDMPHGYTLQLAAVGDSSVVVAEWVSEP